MFGAKPKGTFRPYQLSEPPATPPGGTRRFTGSIATLTAKYWTDRKTVLSQHESTYEGMLGGLGGGSY